MSAGASGVPVPDRAGELMAALLALDRVRAASIVAAAARDHDRLFVMDALVTPVLERLGEAWERGDASLAQLYVASRICDELTLSADTDVPRRHTARVGMAVLDDFHELGKRMVLSVLRAAGYGAVDYGVGLAPGPLADRAAADGLDVLLVSTLMLRSALQVRPLVDRLRARGSRAAVVVVGAPFRFDPSLWQEVGADAGGRTTADALSIVAGLAGVAR